MEKPLNNCSQKILKAIETICWAQWNRLGFYGTGPENPFSTDIECAIVLAVHAHGVNQRLTEALVQWLSHYGKIVNRERLASLLKKMAQHDALHVLGIVLEKLEHHRWKSLLNLCQRHSRISKAAFKNQLSGKKTSFKKLVDEEQLLKKNALIRYRYAMGTNARADVLYLLSLSEQLNEQHKTKKEMDFVTTIRLSSMLGFDESSIFRIQQDFEMAGILGSYSKNENPITMKTTWRSKEKLYFFESDPLEKGIIDWYSMTRELIKALALVERMKEEVNEIILKAEMYDAQQGLFQFLYDYDFIHPHAHPLPRPPLEAYSALDLGWMMALALEEVVANMQ